MRKPAVVICPQCSKEVAWISDNLYRPFCSERCKLIDLGKWASEGYRIPQDESDTEEPSGQA